MVHGLFKNLGTKLYKSKYEGEGEFMERIFKVVSYSP